MPVAFLPEQHVSDVILDDFRRTTTAHTIGQPSARLFFLLNEILPSGFGLFLAIGSQPVSSSPALCAVFDQLVLLCAAGRNRQLFQECSLH